MVENSVLSIRDRKFTIADVSFYQQKLKDWSAWSEMVGMKYIDYGKVSGYGISWDNLMKNPKYAGKTHEQVKELLLWKSISVSVSIVN